MKKVVHIIISFLVLVLAWSAIGWKMHYNESLFPMPKTVLKALIELVSSKDFFVHIRESMYRFLTGYLFASVLAIFFGLLLGWFQKAWEFVNPIVQILRPISPMAWMPFIVLIFGIGNLPAIVIIFISAFFPVLLSTVSGVRGIDSVYLKVADNYGIRKPSIFWKIIFPAALPKIITGLRLAIGTAWIFLVAGEMAGSQSGLGYLIVDCRNNLRNDTLMATILIIGLIGFLLDSLVGVLENHVLAEWGITGKGGES